MADINTLRKTDAPAPKLTAETFKQLGDLIYEMTGIHFQDNKTYLLESRLLPRLKACRCQTFESYLNYLRFDAYRDRFRYTHQRRGARARPGAHGAGR